VTISTIASSGQHQPAAAERSREDIPLLTDHFVDRFRAEKKDIVWISNGVGKYH
jgi:DNA-binding NtrC family response regulator